MNAAADLTPQQCACLQVAGRYGGLRRTRHGYVGQGASGDDSVRGFPARTVFALERAELLASAEAGSQAAFVITDHGRALAGAQA